MDLDPEDYEALGWGGEQLLYEYAVNASRRVEVKARADKAYHSTPKGREVKRLAQRKYAQGNGKERRRHYERTNERYKAAHRKASLKWWHAKGKFNRKARKA